MRINKHPPIVRAYCRGSNERADRIVGAEGAPRTPATAHRPIADSEGAGLNITVFSYQDRVDFGVVADRELIPDLDRMIDSLEQALTELRNAASQLTVETPT